MKQNLLEIMPALSPSDKVYITWWLRSIREGVAPGDAQEKFGENALPDRILAFTDREEIRRCFSAYREKCKCLVSRGTWKMLALHFGWEVGKFSS